MHNMEKRETVDEIKRKRLACDHETLYLVLWSCLEVKGRWVALPAKVLLSG